VNVYIDGTVEGTSTDKDGIFEIKTNALGTVTIKASFIGYEPFSITKDISELKNLIIILRQKPENMHEIVVYSGNYLLKTSSALESKNAVDLVTTAGSEGDLYKSLSMLPGTQVSGTDGRMLVRGGESRESQTYIDGMHVMSPYTAKTDDVTSRGRYSPFIFEGINFSMGGYSPEYSQSLSSILPLSTKDDSKISKIGASLMNVSAGGGGTKAWEKGSASFNFNYTNLQFYNASLYPGEKKYWGKPYIQYSGQNQLRFNVGKEAILKTYFAYDKTLFRHTQEEPFSNIVRDMNYDEDNLYLNSTFNKRFSNRQNLFIGAAYSWNRKIIDQALTNNDRLNVSEQELHIKAKTAKRFSTLYKLEVGMESYIKDYNMNYRGMIHQRSKFDNNISGLFFSNDFSLMQSLFLNLSARVEYSSLNNSLAFLPRIALNYHKKGVTISGIAGKYQQAADNDYLMYNNRLSMENNLQVMLGFYYQNNDKIYRVEMYDKKYDNLPLLTGGKYSSDGDGYSRGIDIFFNDKKFLENFEYMVAYSYNDSKRKYFEYPVADTPEYVTKHNASLTIKYSNWKWRSIIGVTNRFASGWSYHDPNREGLMNATTPNYNSIDVSWTVLAHKKLIIYACISNLFNRHNVYGYVYSPVADVNGFYEREPRMLYRSQSFYIGVFLTLGNNVAYNTSNF